MAFLLLSCIKETKDPAPVSSDPNWEIIQNFPQGESYEFAKLTVFDGRPFVSTFGHYGITPGSSGMLDKFKGSFFYLLPDGWRIYRSTNEAIVDLKVFNNELYGITERKIPFMSGAVQSYHHTYFLFKWVNNDFVNQDTLEFTNKNMITKSSLSATILWENAGKLYMIAENSGTAYGWELSSGQFTDQKEITNINYNSYWAKDNQGIAFTDYRQLNDEFQRTDIVKGYYYNGGNVVTGKTHTFTKRHDGTFSNAYDFYAAANGSLYGYVDSLLNNIDTETKVEILTPGLIFNSSNIKICNGKLYSVVVNRKQACEALGIYDGQTYSQMAFRLPKILDACSKLVDVVEAEGRTYMLLLNRGQYVVVKSN